VIQTIVDKDCYRIFRKGQLGHRNGTILFIIYVCALVLYSITTSTGVYFFFEIASLDPDDYVVVYRWFRYPFETGKWFMTLFFLFRLHFVFGQTAYPVSLWILIPMGILAAANVIYYPIVNTDSVDQSDTAKFALVYSLSSMTMLVDIVLMTFYLRGLFKLILATASCSPRNHITEQNQSPSPNMEQNEQIQSSVRISPKLMSTVTRNTILSLFAIVSSTLVQLTRIILLAMRVTNETPYLISALRCVDCAINAWALYFSFGFGTANYRRLCKICDRGVSTCCSNLASQAIARRNASKNAPYYPVQ